MIWFKSYAICAAHNWMKKEKWFWGRPHLSSTV